MDVWFRDVKAPTPSGLKPTADCLYPTTPLPLGWPVRQKVALKHTTLKAANYTVVGMFCACTRLGGASLVPVIQNMKTGNDGTECMEKQAFRPFHTPRWFTSTPPIRMVIQLAHNQSDGQQPTFSDFACWIGADAVHTDLLFAEQICSRTCPSLPKRFRWPTDGPVCFRLYCD